MDKALLTEDWMLSASLRAGIKMDSFGRGGDRPSCTVSGRDSSRFHCAGRSAPVTLLSIVDAQYKGIRAIKISAVKYIDSQLLLLQFSLKGECAQDVFGDLAKNV